jgi:hypothetical protein
MLGFISKIKTNLNLKIMKNVQVKTIILIAAMWIISYNTMAQKATDMVPQAVIASFSAQYPQAQVKDWKIKNNDYIASFILNNRKSQAFYSPDGAWLNTEITIRHTRSLPMDVRLSLKKGNYASWYIDEIKNVKTPSHNMYLVQVDNNSGNKMVYEDAGSVDNRTLYFNDNGTLIKAVSNN